MSAHLVGTIIFRIPFQVTSSCEPQELFGVIAERWKEAAAVSFYSAKAGASHGVFAMGCIVSSLLAHPVQVDLSQPAAIPVTPGSPPLASPNPSGVCSSCGNNSTCSSNSRWVSSSFSDVWASSRSWAHGEGHQPHTQVTSSVDVEARRWQETSTGSSLPHGHKFVLSLTNFPIFPPQWPPLVTSGSASNVEKQLI